MMHIRARRSRLREAPTEKSQRKLEIQNLNQIQVINGYKFFRLVCLSRANARFDRSTRLAALTLSKGKLTALNKVEGRKARRKSEKTILYVLGDSVIRQGPHA
jgi:hypothetical protein